MKRFWLTCFALAAALGAAAAGKVFSGKGLRTGAPGMNRYTDLAPGGTAPLPRPYPGAPPLIPHSIDGLGVTRAANDCLTCHLEGGEVGDGHQAAKIPPSHFTNPYTKETKTGGVTGTRYNCLQCHAPQAVDAVPPVPQEPRRSF